MSDNTLERMRSIRYGHVNIEAATEAKNKNKSTNANADNANEPKQDKPKEQNQSGFQNEEKIDSNEAGNTQSETESEKNPAEKASLWKEFGDFLAKIIDAISQLFKDFFDKNNLKVEYMLRNDEGFLKDYNEAKKKYKPSEGQEVLIYANINQKKLFDPAQKLQAFIGETINELRGAMLGNELPKDHILAMSADDYKNKVLDILGCPNKEKFDSIGKWVTYVKESALGKKQKVIIRPEDIAKYEPDALRSANALRAIVINDKNKMTELTNELNRAFQAVSTNKNLSDEVRNRAKRYANRAKELLQDYKGIEEEAYTVYATKIQQARLILGRMYNL